MAPVRVMLGVIVSCLVLGLARAQCEKDVDMQGEVLFEEMTWHSDALVSGLVSSIGNNGEYKIELDCIYKTDGSRTERMMTVLASKNNCPSSVMEAGMKYLMFLEKTTNGYVLRYTAFDAEMISEVSTVCGIERTTFVDNEEVCPLPETPCVKYNVPTTPTPEPKVTPEPVVTPKPAPGDVDVVVGSQGDSTPEPEGGTNAATTNFLSYALSCLSFVMSLLML